MNLAQSERSELADLFVTLGPDQPTLCEGWDTEDLLIHLLIRERRPDARAGEFVKPMSGWRDKVAAEYAGRPWPELVAEYRSGPPWWNPMGWGKLEELTNDVEMFIHHEDARRGQPHWRPRIFDPRTVATLERLVGSPFFKHMLRKSPVGVVAKLPSAMVITVKRGEPVVTIVGEPGEIVLWLAGRESSVVELTGDEQAVAALMTVRRGM